MHQFSSRNTRNFLLTNKNIQIHNISILYVYMKIILRISLKHVVNIMQSISSKFQSDRIINTKVIQFNVFHSFEQRCLHMCIRVEDNGRYKTLLLVILSENLLFSQMEISIIEKGNYIESIFVFGDVK